jgi:Xaa-Pro aminopeptidase
MSYAVTAGIDFLERQDKARQVLEKEDLDLLLSTPGTNFRYLTGVQTHRMERLTAFGIPRQGPAFLVCPAFEEDNMRRDLKDTEILTWGETDDPFTLVAETVQRLLGTKIRIGLEPTTFFWTARRFQASLPDAVFNDAGPVFDRLRVRKSAEEADIMRRAADLAEDAACKARLHLKEGMTELEACENLADHLRGCGAGLEAMVQFGPNSAIPHAAAGSRTLRRDDMVLYDLCVSQHGYWADITRMTCFGDATRDMKDIYHMVYDAQQAAINTIRPGVPCQEIDRAARRVIARAGYGDYFLHRTGHGLGMDIHESPYLVDGNEQTLQVGNVITVEPGIYLPGRFGVRIEDDVLVTENGADVLSDGQPALIETP